MSPQEVSQKDSLGLNCKHMSCFTDASHTHGLTFLHFLQMQKVLMPSQKYSSPQIIFAFGPEERNSDWCHRDNGGKDPNRVFFSEQHPVFLIKKMMYFLP